jgi:hypothetical protein
MRDKGGGRREESICFIPHPSSSTLPIPPYSTKDPNSWNLPAARESLSLRAVFPGRGLLGRAPENMLKGWVT